VQSSSVTVARMRCDRCCSTRPTTYSLSRGARRAGCLRGGRAGRGFGDPRMGSSACMQRAGASAHAGPRTRNPGAACGTRGQMWAPVSAPRAPRAPAPIDRVPPHEDVLQQRLDRARRARRERLCRCRSSCRSTARQTITTVRLSDQARPCAEKARQGGPAKGRGSGATPLPRQRGRGLHRNVSGVPCSTLLLGNAGAGPRVQKQAEISQMWWSIKVYCECIGGGECSYVVCDLEAFAECTAGRGGARGAQLQHVAAGRRRSPRAPAAIY
jgi:hypothetical protein